MESDSTVQSTDFIGGQTGHGKLVLNLDLFEDATYTKKSNGFTIMNELVFLQLSLTPTIRNVIFTIEGTIKSSNSGF